MGVIQVDAKIPELHEVAVDPAQPRDHKAVKIDKEPIVSKREYLQGELQYVSSLDWQKQMIVISIIP